MSTGNRTKLFAPLIIFAILSVLFWRGLSIDPSEMPSALLDKPMPEFSLPELKTGENLTAENVKGKPSLVNVWATWCVSCRVEHPYLVKLSQQGVPIIGVNYKDETPAAIKWLEDLGDPYAFNIVDLDGRLGIDLGVFGAPETYVLDKNGVIRYKHVGIVNNQVWTDTLEPIYKELL